MKHQFFARFTCIFITVVLLFGTSSVLAKNVMDIERDVTESVTSFVDDILTFKTKNSSIQQWIDQELVELAGLSSEWYVLALAQSGQYDFSSYEQALLQYLENNKVASASTREKYALVLMSIGSNNSYINEIIDDSIGKQGVMSWIYGLHLLNNGVKSQVHTIESVKAQLLSMQLADGGWAVMGEIGDVDATAMAIQALAPYYKSDSTVEDAINQALELLSQQQLEDGDYASFGIPNLESTAQVVISLSSINIDAQTDRRFIKNGKTLFDGMEKYRLEDESFSHTYGGSFHDGATVQALFAFLSYIRMAEGKEGLYILEHYDPEGSIEQTIKQDDGCSYKTYASIIIIVIACFTSLLFILLKKRNKNNFVFVWILALIGIFLILFTDFQSADEYYNGEDVVKENVIGTVTLTIGCNTILEQLDTSYSYIPKDGIILQETKFDIEEGDTVYQILTEAAQKYKIQLDSSGAEGMVYISGINYLYEFDFGEFSGWVYRVNGTDGSVGCDQYVLRDGDVIEWLYTCELGKDLN